MAKKEISTQWDRDNRNSQNSNFDELYKIVGDVTGAITEEVYSQIIDSAKLNWKEPVSHYENLPPDSLEGDTRMVRYKDINKNVSGKVYRYNGKGWNEIQQIDAGPVNEIDTRLSSQLADTKKQAIEVVSHNNDKSIIASFIDDDGHPNVYSILKPIFESAGVPMTSAVISGNYTGEIDWSHMTLEQLYELKKLGWEICNHTVTHPRLADIPREQLENEVRQASEFLNERGLDGDILVYPYGSQNAAVRRVTRKYSILGVGGYDEYNKMPIETYSFSRFTDISPINPEEFNFDLDACKAIVDNAPNETWIVFYTHVKNNKWEDLANQQKLADLIAYIQSKNIDIVTLREGLNRKGNIVDSGDKEIGKYFKVGRDGTYEEGYSWFDDSITIESPPEYYPEGDSVIAFTSQEANSKGFPNEAAQLRTHRIIHSSAVSNEIYTYQDWYSNYNRTTKRRRWDDVAKNWGDFEEITTKALSKVISMSNTDWRKLSPTRMVECLVIDKFIPFDGYSVTLNKDLWVKSEISTDVATPTEIGRFEHGFLFCYQDNNNVYVKYDAGGNNYKTYVSFAII